MINMMHFIGPTGTVPPLAMEKKLAAVNAMLDKKNKRRVTNVSSSPHVVLTPTHPFHGQNYIVLCGTWSPKDRSYALTGSGNDSMNFAFNTEAQATYLLDISVLSPGPGNWQCNATNPGGEFPLTLQQGHLLYPFIGQGGAL
jgi:hypothetical protein